MISNTRKRVLYAFQLVIVLSAFLMTPQTMTANTFGATDFGGGFQSSIDFPDFDFTEIDFDSIESGESTSSVNISTITECKVFASASQVDFGDSVTISWETEGFDSFTVNGQISSDPNGSVTFDNITKQTEFTLVATNDNGDSCSSTVTVGCNPPPVIHGCTDPEALNYDEHATENDGSCEYPEPPKCEDPSATNTGGPLPCEYPPTPVAPACPLIDKDGRTIISFTDEYLFSDRGLDPSQSAIYAAVLPVAKYDITLVSWDGYVNRVNANQPNEQYFVQFLQESTVISTSNAISDLADNVIEATNTELVNTKFELSSAATGIRAVHAAYPDSSSSNSLQPICVALDEIIPDPEPAPVCVDITATPDTITAGEEIILNWEVQNAISLGLNNGIGDVTGTTTFSVSPIASTTYILEVFGTEGRKVQCDVPVTVLTPTTPAIDINKRDAADGDDTQSVVVGETAVFEIIVTNTGNEDLVNVVVTDVLEPSCDLTIGSLAIGEANTYTCSTTNVTSAFTNVASVTGDSAVDGETVSDSDPTQVNVTDAPVFTCEENVTFTASDTSITRGDSSVLSWNVTDADSVSFTGISATSLTGTETVSPSSDTTYILTALKSGFDPIRCPITIDVSTGGGGGGSSSPRCELEISDSSIKSGDRITLSWDTSRATEVIITDDLGNVVVTTEDRLADDKEELLDGEITLRPTRDTQYTLVAERGSRDRDCSVSVEVEDDIVVLEERDQALLVAGISLSQVPHTGFEAGPLMTMMFYALLVAWTLYLTYVLVIPKTLWQAAPVKSLSSKEDTVMQMQTAEARRPDVFGPLPTAGSNIVASTTAVAPAPTNLPTAPISFAPTSTAHVSTAAPTMAAQTVVGDPIDVAVLEAIAHNNRALLSSDAIKTFTAVVPAAEQLTKIVDVIKSAQAQFPLEDGWVVINNDRMVSALVA